MSWALSFVLGIQELTDDSPSPALTESAFYCNQTLFTLFLLINELIPAFLQDFLGTYDVQSTLKEYYMYVFRGRFKNG